MQGSEHITVDLLPLDSECLTELIRCLNVQGPYKDPCHIEVERAPQDREEFNRITIMWIGTGNAERLTVARDLVGEVQVLWEGDSEYWQEVAEKCAYLLNQGSGHQYLMVRGSSSQNVILSFREP